MQDNPFLITSINIIVLEHIDEITVLVYNDETCQKRSRCLSFLILFCQGNTISACETCLYFILSQKRSSITHISYVQLVHYVRPNFPRVILLQILLKDTFSKCKSLMRNNLLFIKYLSNNTMNISLKAIIQFSPVLLDFCHMFTSYYYIIIECAMLSTSAIRICTFFFASCNILFTKCEHRKKIVTTWNRYKKLQKKNFTPFRFYMFVVR